MLSAAFSYCWAKIRRSECHYTIQMLSKKKSKHQKGGGGERNPAKELEKCHMILMAPWHSE